MENSRFWLFLGLGVTAMLSLKYIAASYTDMSRWTTSGHHSAFNEDDGNIDARRLHAHKVGQASNLHPSLAGLESSMRKTQSAGLVPAAAAATPVPKVEAKKVDKKKAAAKKKKKKTDLNGGQITAPQEQTTASPSSSNAQPSPSTSTGSTTRTQTISYASAAPALNPDDAKNKSLRDWENLLIASPSYAETVKFIKAYQSKSVTASIYYAIVKEMLADKRQVLNQYGVLALQMTPSVPSLGLLVNEQSTDATITAQVTSALSAYTTLSYLTVLKSTLPSLTSTASINTVLGLINKSAAKNLVITPTTSPTGVITQGGVSAATKAQFEVLYTYLDQLKSKATDAAVQAAIVSTLGNLQALGITPMATPTSNIAQAS
jgi:hypothetical protein